MSHTEAQATGDDTTTISLPARYRDAIKQRKPEHMSMGEYVYQLHEDGEAVLFDASEVAAELAESFDVDVDVVQLDKLEEEVGVVQDRLAEIERTLDALAGQ